MNKKGISTIIVSLIMIVLVLAAISIVWVVVSNILSGESERASSSLGQIFLGLNIEKVLVEDNGDVSVNVKRKAGEGNLVGLKFVVSDGTNSEVIERKNINLAELGEKKFTLTSAELSSLSFVKEVSIAPITESDSGKESVGNVVNSHVLTNKQIIENLGAVSWWRFEGNARDEIGNNAGTLQGGMGFVDGKFGDAGDFDGSDDYVDLGTSKIITETGQAFTIGAWVKRDSSAEMHIFSQTNIDGSSQLWRYMLSIGTPFFQAREISEATSTSAVSNSAITIGEWTYVVMTYDPGQFTFYSNGQSDGTSTGTITGTFNTNKVTLGVMQRSTLANYFDGQIDEVMVFDKALTEKQVKALYELNL
tara:strand:+ start:6330 stop:7418 length:1089 start_codon:yes stop_codon:yes gene_type:complete